MSGGSGVPGTPVFNACGSVLSPVPIATGLPCIRTPTQITFLRWSQWGDDAMGDNTFDSVSGRIPVSVWLSDFWPCPAGPAFRQMTVFFAEGRNPANFGPEHNFKLTPERPSREALTSSTAGPLRPTASTDQAGRDGLCLAVGVPALETHDDGYGDALLAVLRRQRPVVGRVLHVAAFDHHRRRRRKVQCAEV